MAKTGLIDNLYDQLNDDWDLYQLKETTPEALEFQKGLTDTLEEFRAIGRTRDPELILAAEKLSLQHEKATYANSPEMMNSIKPALADMDNAMTALDLVTNDKEAYAKAAQTYSNKRRSAGLPLDGFREFIKSHNARLANRLKGVSSGPEKSILRARKENLSRANSAYVELQRRALGLGNDHGLELD